MQALYIILGAMAVLIPGLFVISLFLPATVKVVRTRVVPATVATVFQQVNTLRNWEGWSPWQHKRRRGQVTITESRLHEYIGLDIRLMKRRFATGYFRFQPAKNGTLVTWSLRTELGQHPARRLMGLIMDKWIAKDLERGLENLRKQVLNIS
jgi:hypothetical protein